MTSFLKVNAGNRIHGVMGIQMRSEEYSYVLPKHTQAMGTYIDIPIHALINTSEGKESRKALRNQFVEVVPACTAKLNGNFKLEFSPSRSFDSFGTHSGNWKEEYDGVEKIPSFHLWLRKDLDLDSAEQEFYLRVYLRE